MTVVDDPHRLATLQPQVPVATPEEAHRTRLRAIRGLRLAVEEVRAKFKYGGNVDGPHRRAVAARPAARGGPGDPAAAAHTRLERP